MFNNEKYLYELKTKDIISLRNIHSISKRTLWPGYDIIMTPHWVNEEWKILSKIFYISDDEYSNFEFKLKEKYL